MELAGLASHRGISPIIYKIINLAELIYINYFCCCHIVHRPYRIPAYAPMTIRPSKMR